MARCKRRPGDACLGCSRRKPHHPGVDLGFDSEPDALRYALAKVYYWQREAESRKRVAETITAENAALSLLLHEHGIKAIESGHPYAALLKLSKEPTRAEELLLALERAARGFVEMTVSAEDFVGELCKSSAYLRERGLLK